MLKPPAIISRPRSTVIWSWGGGLEHYASLYVSFTELTKPICRVRIQQDKKLISSGDRRTLSVGYLTSARYVGSTEKPLTIFWDDWTASEEVLFALIKTKCLPILFYGVEACPENSSVRQSFQLHKILFEVFCAMSKDSYRYIYECFGIDTAD